MNRYLIAFVLLAVLTFGQNVKISGKIYEENTGKTIENVMVYSVNFQKSTFSDKNGNYELSLPTSTSYTLKFLYTGYSPITAEITATGSNIMGFDISLTPVSIHLGEVTVTSPRYVSSLQESPYPLGLISKTDFELDSKLSVAEYLTQEPGVSMSRDGIWATDISVRGIRGTGIVLMVDGFRVETATELSARLSLIDQFDIERVEILKGAASSMYGTGALGGIINVITQNRRFRNTFYHTGSFNNYYNSVNQGGGTSLYFNAGSSNWFAKVRGSFRGASATETPDGLITNSHYHDNSFSGALGFKPFDNHELELNYQRYEGTDIGLPGGSAFAAAAIARYPLQKRELISAEYKISEISPLISNISLKYFHQLIVRDAEVVMPTARLLPGADHVSDGVQVTSNWVFSPNYRFVFGLDAWQREMDSKRQRILNAKKDSVIHERPVPISKFKSMGFFFQNEFDNLFKNFNVAIGGRYDYINVTNQESYNPDFVVVRGVVNNNPPGRKLLWSARDENNYSWSFNIASLYKLTKNHHVSFNFGKSFRAPSLEERFQFLDLGGLVKLGDPALEPEEGWFYDLGYRYYSNNAMWKINFFLNTLTNMVVETPGFKYENRPATQMVNFGSAKIFGLDLAFEFHIIDDLILYGRGSIVRGEDTKKTEDLPFMPGDNGTLGLRARAHEYVDISAEIESVMDQNKIAPSEKSTGGYSLVNLIVNLRPIKIAYGELLFTFGVDNIFNRLYFNHLSTNRGLIKAEPGRNIFIKLNYNF